MTERISLRRLHAFVACAEAGTMTGAARQLFVTQGAVSVAISQLERQIGVQLLLRSKAKGLTLTDAGGTSCPRPGPCWPGPTRSRRACVTWAMPLRGAW